MNHQLIRRLEAWGAEPQEVLNDTFLGDYEFYESCLVHFAKEQFLQILQSSLDSGDKESAIRAVHTMKGNADYLGLFPIMDATMTILADLRADLLQQAYDDTTQLELVFEQFKIILCETR